MRILLVADSHGNRPALDAIKERYDVCLCLGDLVEYGPDPLGVIDWTRENAAEVVRGNHDHGTAQNVPIQATGGFRYLTKVTRPNTRHQIGPQGCRYLAGLPTSRMFKLDGLNFLLVHASPRDPLDEYVPKDPAAWQELLHGIEVDFVCVGHTHHQFVLPVGPITVINPGSIGLQRDGDPRAKYAIIENGKIFLKQIDYDIDKVKHQVRALPIEAKAKQMLCDVYTYGNHAQRLRTVS